MGKNFQHVFNGMFCVANEIHICKISKCFFSKEINLRNLYFNQFHWPSVSCLHLSLVIFVLSAFSLLLFFPCYGLYNPIKRFHKLLIVFFNPSIYIYNIWKMMNILHASLDISHVNIKVQIPMWAQAWPWMDGMMKDTYYFKNTKARCWLFFKGTFIKSLTLLFLLFYCYSMVFLWMLAILQESLQCVCSVLAQFFQSWQDMDLKRLLKICISRSIFSTRKSEFPKVYLNRAFFKHCLMG